VPKFAAEPPLVVSFFSVSRKGNAAVLSFIVPGVGQLYNGDFWRALFWLIITPGFWIGSGGTLGWICHLISAYTAYQRAKEDDASSIGTAA
jgi:TM2 domain-containing membrane protein YozV